MMKRKEIVKAIREAVKSEFNNLSDIPYDFRTLRFEFTTEYSVSDDNPIYSVTGPGLNGRELFEVYSDGSAKRSGWEEVL